MQSRTAIIIAASALVAASCGSGEEKTAGNASAVPGAPSNEAAPAGSDSGPANAAAEVPPKEAAASVRYALAPDGLAPGLTFGMKQDDVVAAATAAFGKGARQEHNEECGEGPMDFVSFADLQLGFQEGKFAGWSLSGAKPALQTAGGLTIGMPREALGKTPIDEESSIGPEFDVSGVGGFLDEQGKVMALWAGYPCQFR
jgi:hypothetical protein